MSFDDPKCISISSEGRDKVALTFYNQSLFENIVKKKIPPKLRIEKQIGRQTVAEEATVA